MTIYYFVIVNSIGDFKPNQRIIKTFKNKLKRFLQPLMGLGNTKIYL